MALFITIDDNLWSMGRNDGQLCLDNKEQQLNPCKTAFSNVIYIAAGGYHSLFQTNDMKIFGCGNNQCGQLGFPFSEQKLSVRGISFLENVNIIQFCCGYSCSIMLSDEGKVYCTGNNGHGNLGLGDTNSRVEFTQIFLLFKRFLVLIFFVIYLILMEIFGVLEEMQMVNLAMVIL